MSTHLIPALAIAVTVTLAVCSSNAEEPGRTTEAVDKIGLLPPGPNNPRNSEGDFIQLEDGRILFVYTHFYGGGGDHSAARLAGRFSSDRGGTWTDEDVVVVANEADWNVMSVSLLRLTSGKIALFYFVGDHVLLGHCVGDRRTGGLSSTQITRFPVDWLYK